MAGDKDGLERYRSKRDFEKTSEPGSEKKGSRRSRVFVIQEHDASNLHYDFRLAIDGVLKSWAVPKGPSTDPREKRLAVPTEDHPLKYADFEGVIPQGEYGSGPVLLWDKGTYRNLRSKKEKGEDDAASMLQSYEQGHIEVWLKGKKIRGGYALIKTGKGKDGRWLLVKMKDDEADARRNPVSTEPASVKSGRRIEEMQESDE